MKRTWMLATALCLLWGSAVSAQAQDAANPYAALRDWPDWSGWWALDQPVTDEWSRNPPPLKGDIAQVMDDYRNNTEADPLRFCRPRQFSGGVTGDFIAAIEFLYTPGRVTITGENGFLRRIFIDGQADLDTVAPSNMGTSIGHWEGATLVVETRGIDPSARYPGGALRTEPVGEGVRILERITRLDDDTLQIEVTTEAPAVLTRSDKRTRTYTRQAKALPDEVNLCVEYDRSFDPTTGLERFDMTPPPDLPPPPMD